MTGHSEPALSRRTLLRGAAGTAAAVMLGGCGATERTSRPRTLRLPSNSFGFPSPFGYIAGPGYVQMSYLYDSLLWKDASGRLLPWLARRHERSRDGLTYTFELRPGVTWHDGRPLTAADVAFTFEYFARQSLGPLLVAQPFGVERARAISSQVVQVRLKVPAVTFLESVAGALPIIPKHVWSSIEDAPRAQERSVLVGTGPYRLASYAPGEGALLFTANERYFLGSPFVRRLELVPVDDELRALAAGQIDAAATATEGAGRDVLAPFRGADYGTVSSTGSFSFPLIFNLGRGGALADVRFRRACALAIDRRAIVQRLLGGQGEPGSAGFLPRGHAFAVDVPEHAFDPAAANRLLDAAGYRRGPGGVRRDDRGRRLRYKLLTGNSPVPPMLDLLIASLGAVGVEVRPQAVDLPTLFGRLQEGADDMALSLYPGPGGTAPDADPDTLRTFFASTVKGRLQGAQGWVHPQFDRLAGRQLVTADIAARRVLVGRMQRIVAAELPALALYYPTLFHVFRRRAFDAWYHTPGGFAGGLPGVLNKHAFITGTKTGLKVRRSSG